MNPEKIANKLVGFASSKWTWAIVVVLFLALFLKPFVIVKDTEEAVITQWNGKVVEQPLKQGFTVMNPLNSVTFYPMTYQVIQLENIKLPARDGFKTEFDLTITGNFIPGMTPSIQKDAGSAQAFYQKQVDRIIKAELTNNSLKLVVDSKNYFNNGNGKEAAPVNGETMFHTVSQSTIENANKKLEPLGFRIRSIEATRIELPPEVMKVVTETKQKEEATIRQTAQLEIANLKAQEKEKVATAEANATRTTAQAEKDATMLAAEGKLYAAEKEALANKQLAESVTTPLIQYMDAQAKLRWDGVLPTTSVGANTPMIMNLK